MAVKVALMTKDGEIKGLDEAGVPKEIRDFAMKMAKEMEEEIEGNNKEENKEDVSEIYEGLLGSKAEALREELDKEDADKAVELSKKIIKLVTDEFDNKLGINEIMMANVASDLASLSFHRGLIKMLDSKCDCTACTKKGCKGRDTEYIPKKRAGLAFDKEAFFNAFKDKKVDENKIAMAIYDGVITLDDVSKGLGMEVASSVLTIASRMLEEDKNVPTEVLEEVRKIKDFSPKDGSVSELIRLMENASEPAKRLLSREALNELKDYKGSDVVLNALKGMIAK